jgi:hypothetical protein
MIKTIEKTKIIQLIIHSIIHHLKCLIQLKNKNIFTVIKANWNEVKNVF